MLGRRGFLGALAAGAVALDPERLLWRPGARVVSIPSHVRLPQEFQFGVDFIDPRIKPLTFGLDSSPRALFVPDGMPELLENALRRTLDEHLRITGKSEARFMRLDLPLRLDLPEVGREVFVTRIPLGKLPEVRIVRAYDVRINGFVLRADCRVRI